MCVLQEGKTPREQAIEKRRRHWETTAEFLEGYEREFETKYGRDVGLGCDKYKRYQRLLNQRKELIRSMEVCQSSC